MFALARVLARYITLDSNHTNMSSWRGKMQADGLLGTTDSDRNSLTKSNHFNAPFWNKMAFAFFLSLLTIFVNNYCCLFMMRVCLITLTPFSQKVEREQEREEKK